MDHQLIQLTHRVPSLSEEESSSHLFMSTTLYLAVYKGQIEEVMALLLQNDGIQDGQCDVHAVSAGGNTVLHIAAEQGHGELIRELHLRFRDAADLSARNLALDTPLHCAARAGHDAAVAVLVQLGRGFAVLGCKNGSGETALHLAARHGHGAAVEALVSAAPEAASELSHSGVSPLYLAVMSSSVPAVRAITGKGRDVSSVGPGSQNALHAAVFQSPEMVDLLLNWEPSLAGKVDSNGSSALHFASSDGCLPIVIAILRVAPRSTVYMRDSAGLSALHVAAAMGHERVADKLINAYPDAAELRDGHGGSFLHAAARGRRSSVVSMAIKNPKMAGLLVAPDNDGNTPLHLAVAAGASAVAEALIRTGRVRLDVMNNDGHTPFDLAAKSTSFFSTIILVVILAAYGVQPRPKRQDSLGHEWDDGDNDMAEMIRNSSGSDGLAVVAGLLATVAFSAAFNVPGGYGDDGQAVLQARTAYAFFITLDSAALAASILAVFLLVHAKASGSWRTFTAALQCIWVSLLAMVLAFWASSVAVTTRSSIRTTVYPVIYFGMYFLAAFIVNSFMPVSWRTICRFVCRVLLLGRSHRARRRRVARQFPFAGSYSRNLLLFMVVNVLVYVAVLITYNRISANST